MQRRQRTLAGSGFDKYTKTTRRAQFLAEMDRVVPWRALCARIDPVYPKAGHGRPPVGVKRMLRMYFLQHWFNLSDPAVEEALYDSPTMRAFVGIDRGANRCRMRRRCASSGICWSSRGWARSSLTRSDATCGPRA
jgi:transposase, IS5 family